MPKVLIADALSPRAAEILGARGIEVDFRPGLPAPELKECIGAYEGLAVRSATKVTKGLLAHAGNLRVIGRAGIGVDNIDVEAATQRGIVVMNTPYGNSITAAEHTIAMLFALCRQIPAADRSTQALIIARLCSERATSPSSPPTLSAHFSESSASSTHSIEGVLIVSPRKTPSISLPLEVSRKSFGSGQGGV